MVSCNQQPNEDGDYVCGWDEGDDFCIGYHCEVCSISLCSPDCGDEYCARTRSPADREQTKCMLCAHPLEDEEYDTDLETWVKDGKKIEWDGLSFSYPCEECGIDPCDCTNYSAETFDVEFNEWADQEMNSHGKNISFKDWAEDEGMKHGNSEITDWAQHEDESHDARYGAEELKRDSCCCGATKSKPCACMIQGVMECNATCPCSLEKNWGGDPKGKLALALQKARDKSKEPKKSLKIEKLGAEGDYECSECESHELRYLEYALPENNGFFCMNCGHSPCGINEIDNKLCTCDMMEYGKYTWLGEMPRTQFPSFYDLKTVEGFKKQEQDKENERIRIVGSKEKLDAIRKGAETSGQWEIGEQLEEAQMNAENYRYVKPVPISHSGGGNKYNGYYAIKGYEEPTADGFTYRILSSPGTKDWYRVYVYDTEKMFQNKSRRLNPSGKMVGSSNPASHLIGSFPRLDDAKRALVFRMIQDEQYHHILSDGNLNWLLHGKNPGSRKWKAEKGIDTFTQPFEESSLDSGTVKSVLVGLGIGALALFGYNKWK